MRSGQACPKECKLSTSSKEAHARAEALFKKKEAMLREGQEAMAEYEANRQAERAKTARLRALRLARDTVLEAKKRPGVKTSG
jgi:hypothetical protein